MPVIDRAFIPSVTVRRTPGRAATAELAVKVKDVLIKQQLSGFDGMEHAFAMVPKERGGKVTWQRVELGYAGPTIAGYYDRELVDLHTAKVSQADAKAIAKYGAAFGVETNEGVVWAQTSGHNTKPTP